MEWIVEVEERRMQLWVVTASRPVVGAGLQALASSPGEAAETRQLRLEEKRCCSQRRETVSRISRISQGLFVFRTQAQHSHAAHTSSVEISMMDLNLLVSKIISIRNMLKACCSQTLCSYFLCQHVLMSILFILII